MPILVDLDNMAERYGINLSVDDVEAKLIAAMNAATVMLEKAIRTSFARTTLSDVFWVDSSEKPWLNGFAEVLTSSGWLDSSQTLEVRIDPNLYSIDSQSAVDASNYMVNFTQGIVKLVPSDKWDVYVNDRFYLKLTATSGFETINSFYGQQYKNVPEDLQELAMQLGYSIYSEDCEGTDCDRLPAMFQIMLDAVIRFHPHIPQPL